MLHRKLRYATGWEWHLVLQTEDQSVQQLKRAFPECASWIDECINRENNNITVYEQAGGESVLHGTLLFQMAEGEDVQSMHFWMVKDRLITLHKDLRLSIRLQTPPWEEKLERCVSAPEAFLVITSAILETLHTGLDAFEARLSRLEAAMHRRNRTGLIDEIFERRYDLLHWSHLFIPIREIHGAAKEGFVKTLGQTDSFERFEYKLERIETLLRYYNQEIDTLISMDDAIATFRGNDIMKTLTIFTAMFTPAAVIGALWGMNFEPLPWSNEMWGFTAMCGIILVLTLCIYAWLWKKGWTGDLLKGSKKKQPGTGSKKSNSRKSRHARSSSKKNAAPSGFSGEPEPLRRSRRHS
ncbi:magnesium transporter CorA family protein [Paenibacillus abyssi]|uniref:Magnesium transport protein CorA n=1 Tax=Paenibacillus abyssi TaxID=1340531 RepID=A0A917CQW2_9BACL|nr:magnesium transporter CorA family protein [Paenibacillus abyssi]GGF95593.1 magnesium transport protein CorA [Paenibacillus abyssi]